MIETKRRDDGADMLPHTCLEQRPGQRDGHDSITSADTDESHATTKVTLLRKAEASTTRAKVEQTEPMWELMKNTNLQEQSSVNCKKTTRLASFKKKRKNQVALGEVKCRLSFAFTALYRPSE